MQADPLGVLLVGMAARDGIEDVGAQLCRLLPAARLQRASDIPSALAYVDDQQWSPDLVVVCQRWPDEFPASHVDRLIGTLSWARFVCCYGPWCTADGRTRTHWPLAVRVPTACASARIRRELEVLNHQRVALPVTASRDETFGFDLDEANQPSLDRLTRQPDRDGIQIVSADRQLRHWIGQMLRQSGWAIDFETAHPRSDVRLCVWDVDPWNARMADSVRQYCGEHASTAVVALMGFDHPSDVAEVLRSGVARTVSKCWASDQLVPAVCDSLRRP